jgi:glycosyltransferase involved in cell wall biosynthesis
MRDIVIAPFPPPTGGVAAAAINVTRALEEDGRTVVRFDTSAHASHEDIYRRRRLGAVLRNLGLIARFTRDVIGHGRRADLCHVFVTSDRAFLRDVVLLFLLRIFRRKIIVHLHSKPVGEYFVEPHRLVAFGRMLSLGSRVVVLSDHHREFFQKYIPGDKIRVLENFVIAADFAPATEARPQDILYLSRISEMKGIWDLMGAINHLSQASEPRVFRVTVAGTADTVETYEALRAYVADKRLQPFVDFVGHVEGEAKKSCFRKNGVFVFPSKFENSPVTLKEATQVGMAIVASDIDANVVVLSRNQNYLLYPAGDFRALAAALARLMDNRELYERLRAQSLQGKKFDESYALPILRGILNELR